MELLLEDKNIGHYLESSEMLDFGYRRSAEVANLSYELACASENGLEFIRNAYEYVRDRIAHSVDIGAGRVTCKASEALKARQGICFAKCHLLVSLLRCNLIPAGFCYQSLLLDGQDLSRFTLHGLAAVYIRELDRWVRLDARRNKPGVDSQFSLEKEQLAFPVRAHLGERDFITIYANPDSNVVQALNTHTSMEELWEHLPMKLSG